MTFYRAILSQLKNPYKTVETTYYKLSVKTEHALVTNKNEFVKLTTEENPSMGMYTEAFYNPATNDVKIKKHFFNVF